MRRRLRRKDRKQRKAAFFDEQWAAFRARVDGALMDPEVTAKLRAEINQTTPRDCAWIEEALKRDGN